ncbi:MAG: AbrB family transcriptional regulator [Planctomycetota bacterium]
MTPAKLGAAAVTIVAAAATGAMCWALGLPLPWMLGGILATSVLAIAGVSPFGQPVGIPTWMRWYCVPVIGVSIGTAMTPQVLEDATRWWPSLLALVAYIPIAHVAAFWAVNRLGGLDRATSFFGTMPGGFIESVVMAEEAKADDALVSVMQLLRLIVCLATIPLGFFILTGGAVGSASGAVIGAVPLSVADWGILIASGAVGALAGRALRLPAWVITGPFVVSCFVHLVGWVEGGPPGWFVDMTQAVVGISVGQRFVGKDHGLLTRAARVSVVGVAVMLAATAGFAVALQGLVDDGWQAVFLAFAPGGLTEMSLVALSLEIGVVYVTVHHVLRIILSVVWAKWAGRRVFGVAA